MEIALSAPMSFLSPPLHALATQATLAYSLSVVRAIN